MPRLPLISCLILSFALAFSAVAQTGKEDRGAQLRSFELVWSAVRDHNPDAALNGLDWQAVHDQFRPRIAAAQSNVEVRGILREMVGKLGVSHYAIIPGGLYTPTAEPPTPKAVARPMASVKPTPTAKPSTSPDNKATPVTSDAGMKRVAEPPPAASAASLVTFGNLPQMRLEYEARRLPSGVGYVRFNEFLDPVTLMPWFESTMRDFANAPGVILDLRGNPGGIGVMATGIAGFFIDESGRQLGTMRMRDMTLKFTVFRRADVYKGRLAILLDEGSASTTEILAQGLQDLKRARIFGTRSAGATLPSDIIRLPNGDGFQYPTASYTSVNGRVLEGNGVIPDVEVKAAGDSVIVAASDWIVSAR